MIVQAAADSQPWATAASSFTVVPAGWCASYKQVPMLIIPACIPLQFPDREGGRMHNTNEQVA